MIVDQIKKRENKLINNKNSRIDIPVGKWVKCENCKEILYKENLRNNLSVCPNCGHYFRMHIGRRLEQIIDEGTYKRFNLNIDTTNPLDLEDYEKKIKSLREKTRLEEAVSCGIGKINGEDVVICIMDSGFLMGSMGAVVGEKITYSIEKAIEFKMPIVIFCCSGGARMQEGIISLMQMAKTRQSRLAVYICTNRPNIWWSYSFFCKPRRYNFSRTGCNDWVCRAKSNKANYWRRIA